MKFITLIKCSLTVILLGMPLTAVAGELAIIVNSENTVGNLDQNDIKKYLLKENLSWPNGAKVRSVDRKGSPPERKVFLKEIAQMSPENLEKYWVSKRYEKGIPVPPRLGGDQQIIEYVQSFEGAISYVNASSIGEAQRATIKIVGTVPMP